jgi:hypothetical protein
MSKPRRWSDEWWITGDLDDSCPRIRWALLGLLSTGLFLSLFAGTGYFALQGQEWASNFAFPVTCIFAGIPWLIVAIIGLTTVAVQ